jgi:hypothetical protein
MQVAELNFSNSSFRNNAKPSSSPYLLSSSIPMPITVLQAGFHALVVARNQKLSFDRAMRTLTRRALHMPAST